MAGSLVVVGTGITALRQITREAEAEIRDAEKVFFSVSDTVTAHWISSINTTAESLNAAYEEGRLRDTSYQVMVQQVMSAVRNRMRVCLALYGHPGVVAKPGHAAIAVAKQEGFPARMLPGVGAHDCLFADLGFDPAAHGLQCFEATQLISRRPRIDPTVPLIVWQSGIVNQREYGPAASVESLRYLTDYLQTFYSGSHVVTLYEAATHVLMAPSIQSVPLRALPDALVGWMATVFIPPLLTELPTGSGR